MQGPLDIAVVGLGGVFPGAPDTAAFWRNIAAGRSAVAPAPAERWAAPAADMVSSTPAPDKALTDRCALVRDFCFDPHGFRVPAATLDALDPLYHLVLTAGREATANGCTSGVDPRRIGAFLAAIALPTDGSSSFSLQVVWNAIAAHLSEPVRIDFPGLHRQACLAARVTSLPAALLAAALGFEGGSLTLDAACASSLYAIRLACDALTAGRLDAALAGGVSRPDCLYTQVGFSQLRALSPSGRCAPFDTGADGLVVGEGVGIVALKRRADAVAHQDRIFGVIRSVGLSNDMRGNLLAPDTEGQLRAMQAAYEKAGWQPRDVDLIECHGAGTPVGDQTEIESLHRLWEGDEPAAACAIGSVKSMIGHLLTAAGAAGLIKVLLGLAHQTLPPSLNCDTPIDPRLGADGPLRVQTRAADWPRHDAHRPRRAAVSAFGFGGINAHLLLEEWIAPEPEPTGTKREPVTVGSTPAAVAVVGLAAHIGPLTDLDAFAGTVGANRTALAPIEKRRWRDLESESLLCRTGRLRGCVLEPLSIPAGRFRIPPNEIPDILAQQLLMLRVAADAIEDAGLALRQRRPRTGAVIGIEFDPEANDFNLRWRCRHGSVPQAVRSAIARRTGSDLAGRRWLDALGQALSPPLDPVRTVGALGGIVASRLAREFQLGGPSFGVSADACGGMRALETAVRLLQQGDADLMLAGAVELTGDLRSLAINQRLHGFTSAAAPRPFTTAADGTLPGEGAVALVLRRLDDARRDGDRVYARIDGFGVAGGGGIQPDRFPPAVYGRSIEMALAEAGHAPAAVDLLEVLGSGMPALDRVEDQALEAIWPAADGSSVPLTAALCPQVGHTGAVAGLAGVLRAALGLYRGICPAPARRPSATTAGPPQIACAGAVSADGNAAHVVLRVADGPRTDRRDASPPTAIRTESGARVPVGRPLDLPLLPLPTSPAADALASEPTQPSAPARSAAPDPPDGFRAVEALVRNTAATAGAHETFLDLSQRLTRQYRDAFALWGRLRSDLGGGAEAAPTVPPAIASCDTDPIAAGRTEPGSAPSLPPAFDRNQCLEFARGRVADVLGPAFAEVDTFPVRVRLPDEPLMLVDRIVTVEAEMLSMASGRVVTEHDVRPDAWYLDGGRAPVCISVEAGQADLFLCSYLGIDHQVGGQRSYRLLDAKVRFHRELPAAGETIRYDIHIDRFVRQGQTWIFFFRFEGTIDGVPLISMRDGCAGFFTPDEVRASGGIVPADAAALAATRRPEDWRPPVAICVTALDERELEALRRGDLAAAFGRKFAGLSLPERQRLPGGRMHLIDRVRRLDPAGGAYGLGTVEAEADIDPGAWYLTCHFVDDRVMPGTLMYECCAHTLRVFLQAMGWVSEDPGSHFEPVTGIEAILKCRGPVTPETRQVVYRVDIREIGYRPEPFVVADAHMYADGHEIVMFRGMSLQLTGSDRANIDGLWNGRSLPSTKAAADVPAADVPLYDHRRILAFSVGRPSEAFGEPYRIFDHDRRIARLPGPPYLFMDRIVDAGPAPFELKPGGWVTAEYDVPPDAWYFRADRSGGVMPFCVLLEIALQPCGWLAAYLGSALRSDQDLRFRNLDGQAMISRPVTRDSDRLTMHARLKQVSEAGAMIIETFDMQVSDRQGLVYGGETTFGFFTAGALAHQVGLREAATLRHADPSDIAETPPPTALTERKPAAPDDPVTEPGVGMPGRALCMVDTVDLYRPHGGPHGRGLLRGTKRVDPDEWFFAAHFFQDPVCPGSLGIESFLQLLRFALLAGRPELPPGARIEPVCGRPHRWSYRGQVVPADTAVTVEAIVRDRKGDPCNEIQGDGLLAVDGRWIYQMTDFGIRIVAGSAASDENDESDSER